MNKRKNNGRRRQPNGKRRANRRRLVMITPEVKHHDLTIAEPIFNAGAVDGTPWNAMLEGLGSEQRIGSKIHIHKVSFRGFLAPTAATDGEDVVRMLVVQDKQASGQTPTVANVLQTASTSSFRNRDTTKRFNILYDERFVWSTNTIDVAGTALIEKNVLIEFFKEVDIEVQYLSSASTFAAINTNSIFLLTLSKEADDTTLNGIARISFTDV